MPEPTTTTLALAVWPPPTSTRRASYLAASAGQHRIAPDLAARAILAYTDPGDLVVDPDCGVGTVLVEAIQQGRRAIGLTANPAKAALASANVSHARAQGAPGRAAVLEAEPDQLQRALAKAIAILNPTNDRQAKHRVARHPAGSTQLLLTVAPTNSTAERLNGWTGVLAPGGFLLLVHRHTGAAPARRLSTTVAAAEQAGLQYWQHVIALRTSRAEPDTLLHTDVLCFRKPGNATTAHAQRTARAVAA
jgi:hypothetical protein